MSGLLSVAQSAHRRRWRQPPSACRRQGNWLGDHEHTWPARRSRGLRL